MNREYELPPRGATAISARSVGGVYRQTIAARVLSAVGPHVEGGRYLDRPRLSALARDVGAPVETVLNALDALHVRGLLHLGPCGVNAHGDAWQVRAPGWHGCELCAARGDVQ